MAEKMKAWIVKDRDEFNATVVFAETRGKARAIAQTTDCCEDLDYCYIEVKRAEAIDKYYKDGKTEMEWYDPQDRLALVKELGFCCEYIELWECSQCSAREFCDRKEEIEEMEENDNG